VFIKILGEAAIRNYVFGRIADILSAYLPERLMNPDVPLEVKLQDYGSYLKEHKF